MTIQTQASPISAPTLPAQPLDPKLKKQCVAFEGQFFDMMLQEMRKTIPDDPELGDSDHQQQIFQGMMDDQVSQQMAQHGGANDLAQQMYNQLILREQPAAAAQASEAAESETPAVLSTNAVVSTLRKSAK